MRDEGSNSMRRNTNKEVYLRSENSEKLSIVSKSNSPIHSHVTVEKAEMSISSFSLKFRAYVGEMSVHEKDLKDK